MSQNIVFKDNIFQISESLSVINGGTKLELDEVLFAKKTVSDLIFFDVALQNIFDRIEDQKHLPEYLDIMQSLYFCIKKFIDVLGTVTSKKEYNLGLVNNCEKIDSIYSKHQNLLDKIKEFVQTEDITQDSVNIVSENELSELLNFG